MSELFTIIISAIGMSALVFAVVFAGLAFHVRYSQGEGTTRGLVFFKTVGHFDSRFRGISRAPRHPGIPLAR